MGFSPPGGGGGVTTVFGRPGPAITAVSGDYNASQVTNAADKSSAATQAFTATVTSNGNMSAQQVLGSRANTPSSGGIAGRHDGGAPTSGNFQAGVMVLDYTTPGIWMTSAGGNPPSDWINLIAGAHGLGFTIDEFTGASGALSLLAGTLYEVVSLVGNAQGNLPPASSVTGTPNWLIFMRLDATTNLLTLVPNGTDTINGSNSPITVSTGSSLWVVSDGASNWIVIATANLQTLLTAPITTILTGQSYT